MKKLTKVIAGVACLATLACGAAACGGNGAKEVSGEAYAMVHTAGSYIGYSKVTKKGDKITKVTLTEICLPNHVSTLPEGVEAEDKVVDGTKTYYKTVKYGNVTMVYDLVAKNYTINGESAKDYYMDNAHAEEYYKAVVAGNVAVVVGGAEDKTVMTYNALSKEVNGYWTKQDTNSNNYSRWKMNRDATCAYVVSYGIGNLTSLVKSTEGVTDAYGVSAKYWMDGDISTGATWNDFNNPNLVNSTTYAQLIINAYNAIK